MDFPGRDAALAALDAIPAVHLAHYPTPVEPLARFAQALGATSHLVVKRDDAISFGFGGNKVRKVELVAARAIADGADTLITTGGLQSNHARVTAAAAAKLGLHCVLVLNGRPPTTLTANTLLDRLFGADVRYVERREDRAPVMREMADRLRAEGRHPVEIPLGASTPLGALGLARAIGELVHQDEVPDVIVHSTSSGGTQSGLVAGCLLHGLATRVVGISADTPSDDMKGIVLDLLGGMAALLGLPAETLARGDRVTVDDRFVGEGYGIPTEASRDASALMARTEALIVDHTYTAKALAGLVAWVRDGRIRADETVMFWHTGGQVGVFG